jgi:streptogramin lyase
MSLAMSTKPRRRSAIAVLWATVLAFVLALPSFASADPLGSSALYSSGLRAGTAFSGPLIVNVTPGPDGNVWFVDNKLFASNIPAIGKITTSGTITEYVAGTNLSGLTTGPTGSDPVAIVAGPGGSKYLWFTDKGTASPSIGVIDSASPETATLFSISGKGGNAGSVPQGITVGPDGNLWFADASPTAPAIGKVELSGNEVTKITECPIGGEKGGNAGSVPRGIVAGPDGNLWFTDNGTTKAIGKVNPGTCAIEEFALGGGSEPGGSNSPFGPWGITPGPDGNVWFTENGNNETNGKSICRITTSGTITCFKEGLAASSSPRGLTAANGKLWFTDESGKKEVQELTIEDSGTLGGTYKLSFEGKETGATGKGNLLSSAKGKGNVMRFTSTACPRVNTSKELICTVTPTAAEAGMRIEATGIPTNEPFTTIEKIEGNTIFMTRAATANSSTEVKAGRVIFPEIANIESGKFEPGQTLTGNMPASTLVASTEEKEGKVIVVPSKAPSTAGTGVTVEGKTTTVVTGVSTTTGAFSKGERITGTGISAGTTISAVNTNLNTLTLSTTPEAGTGVSLSADLGFDASSTAVQEALEKLSTIGSPNVEVTGSGSTSPIKRSITFTNGLSATDVPQLSCNSSGLTGTSPTCGVTTTTAGTPNAIGRITTSGKITRYTELAKGFTSANGITLGSGGNLWFPTGLLAWQKMGKFGIESTDPKLTVTKEGTGDGTVVSNPAGIECGKTCVEDFETGEKVTLTASPDSESLFVSWKGCETGGAIGRTCKVTMNEAKTVTAKFIQAYDVSVTREGTGLGKVQSAPSGILCLSNCSTTKGAFKELTSVTLTATPSKNYTFTKWTGDCTGESTTCVLSTLEADKSVGAEFTAVPQFNLTLTKTGGGQGTVKAKQAGINCGLTCTSQAAAYFKGAVIELLVPLPGKGSTFAGWSGAGCSGTGTCLVTMNEAKSVEAKFE